MAEKIDELYWVLDARTGAFVQGMNKSQKSLDRFVSKLKGPGGAAVALAAVGAVATIVAIKAAKMAAELDKAFREVLTLLPGAANEYDNLRQSIIDLSTRVPAPPDQLSKGLYQVISAGITDTTEAMYVLETATKAATAGLTDTFTAVDAITTVLNAYQLEASEAARISDVFFATVREGKLKFEDIAANIGNVATSAALAGVSIEELGAAMATMTKFGISAGESATALNRFILSLTMATTDQVEAAERLGIEFNLTALRSKGLIGFMQEMAEATQGNLELLSEINPNIRAARAAFILAGEGIGEYTRILKETQNAAGAAGQAFNKMEGSLQEQWALLKNKVNKVWLALGNEILPGVIQAIEGLNAVLSSETERQITLLRRLGLEEEALNLEREHMVRQRGEQIEEESRDLDRLLSKYEEAGRRAAFMRLPAFVPGVAARGSSGQFRDLQEVFSEEELGSLLPRLDKYDPADFMLSGSGTADEVRDILETAIKYGETLVRTRDLTDETKIKVQQLVREHQQALAILDRIKASQQTITDLTAPDPELSRLEQRISILKKGGPALAEEVAQLEALRDKKLLDLEISETRLELQLALNEAYVAGAQIFTATATAAADLDDLTPAQRMADLEKTITQSQERRAELVKQAAGFRAAAIGKLKQEEFAFIAMARQAEMQAESFERTEQTAKIMLALEKSRASHGREVAASAGDTSSALQDQATVLTEIAKQTSELTEAGAMSALSQVLALRDAAVAAFGELPDEVERDLNRLQQIAEQALDATLYERFVAEVRENIATAVRDAQLAAFDQGAEDSGIETVGLIAGNEALTLERERVKAAVEELEISVANEESRERLLDLLRWIEEQLRANIRAQDRSTQSAEREAEAREQASRQQSKAQREAEQAARARFQEQQTIISLIRQGVNGTLDLAKAFGSVDEEIVRIIESLTDAVVGAKTLYDSIKLTQALSAAGSSTLPGIAGIVSGGLGLLGGLASSITSGPDPDLERARRIGEENTDAIRRLTDSIDRLREFMFALPGEFSQALQAMQQAVEGADLAGKDQFRNISGYIQAGRGGGLPLVGATDELLAAMDKWGLTITDLEQIASKADLSIEDLTSVIEQMQAGATEFDGKEVAAAAEQWRALMDTMATGVTDFFGTVEGKIESAQREIDLFDIEEPIAKIGKLVDILETSNVQLSPAEMERLRAADESLIQELVKEIETGTGRFAEGFSPLGEFSPDQFIDFLSQIERLGDETEDAAGGTASFQTVSRITMEQAGLIIAALSTQTFYLRSIAENTAALADGREIEVPLPGTPEPDPRYIPEPGTPDRIPGPSPETPAESGGQLPWDEYFPAATDRDMTSQLDHVLSVLRDIRIAPDIATEFGAKLAGTLSAGLVPPTEDDMRRFTAEPQSGATTLVFEPGSVTVEVETLDEAGPVLAEEVNRVLGTLFEQNRRGVGLPTVRY